MSRKRNEAKKEVKSSVPKFMSKKKYLFYRYIDKLVPLKDFVSSMKTS